MENCSRTRSKSCAMFGRLGLSGGTMLYDGNRKKSHIKFLQKRNRSDSSCNALYGSPLKLRSHIRRKISDYFSPKKHIHPNSQICQALIKTNTIFQKN